MFSSRFRNEPFHADTAHKPTSDVQLENGESKLSDLTSDSVSRMSNEIQDRGPQ